LEYWAAQAASLFISAACRDAFHGLSASTSSDKFPRVAGKLPATTGWQPVLPRNRRTLKARAPN